MSRAVDLNDLRRSVFAVLLSGCAACSAHPVVPAIARPMSATTTTAPLSVFVLTPVVRIEQMPPAGAVLSYAPNATVRSSSNAEVLTASLRDAGKTAAAALTSTVIDCRDARDVQAELCKELDPFAGRLAQGSARADARSVLRHAGDVQPDCAVLASLLAVELGPGDYYNSATGQMGSAMSMSAFRATLTRCDTASVLWRNEVLLRAVPDLKDSGCMESVHALFEGPAVPK